MPDFTPSNVAKYVVTAAIQYKVSSVTEDAIVDYTHFEEDDFIVGIGSHVVGWGVAYKLKPITDRMVDKTHKRIVAIKNKRKQKAEKTNK